MTTVKRQTAIRLSEETERIILALKQDTGLTTTGVIELALRDMAKARGISERNRDHQGAVASLRTARQTAIASETALGHIWNDPEEDKAWADL